MSLSYPRGGYVNYVSFPSGFLPRCPPRLPLHLMKSPEAQSQGGNQPKAGPLRAGTGYMSSDGTNVSIGITLSGHRAACQEALSLPRVVLAGPLWAEG